MRHRHRWEGNMKMALKRWVSNVGTGITWLMLGISGRSCEHGNKSSGWKVSGVIGNRFSLVYIVLLVYTFTLLTFGANLHSCRVQCIFSYHNFHDLSPPHDLANALLSLAPSLVRVSGEVVSYVGFWAYTSTMIVNHGL